MSVHKDNERKTWYFRVRVGNKNIIRRSKKWKKKTDAQKAEREFLNKQELQDLTKENMTFNEVAAAYINYSKLHKKQSSVNTMTTILNNHATPFFNNKPINKITSKHIEDYQVYLLEKTYTDSSGTKIRYANESTSKFQIQTRLVFNYALRHRIIPHNPFDQVETAKNHDLESKREFNILTYAEFKQFMKSLPSNTIEEITEKTLYSILYWNGLRYGELVGLNINDVNIQDKLLRINKNYDYKNQVMTSTKTGETRVIDLPDRCIVQINDLLKEYEQIPHKKTFALLGLRKRLSKTTLERSKEALVANSGIKYFTFQDLRHTHVSTLIQLGWRDIDIAKRLGHSVEMVNNTYGHLFKSDRVNMMKRLNEME